MALLIYDIADPQSAFSENGDFTNPLSLSFDGVEGGIIKQKLFVRNNDTSKSYTGITITPVDGGDGLVNGADGFSWKLVAGDEEPLEEQWAGVAAGNIISIPDIGDSTTYQPFWIRVEVPSGSSIQSFQSVQLKIDATAS